MISGRKCRWRRTWGSPGTDMGLARRLIVAQIARQINALGVQVLIDLTGHAAARQATRRPYHVEARRGANRTGPLAQVHRRAEDRSLRPTARARPNRVSAAAPCRSLPQDASMGRRDRRVLHSSCAGIWSTQARSARAPIRCPSMSGRGSIVVRRTARLAPEAKLQGIGARWRCFAWLLLRLCSKSSFRIGLRRLLRWRRSSPRRCSSCRTATSCPPTPAHPHARAPALIEWALVL